jgi:hypothetical protein
MPPSESSFKVQPINLKHTQRRLLLSKSSPTVRSLSSYSVNREKTFFLDDPKRHTEVNSMATELTPVKEHSVDQRLLISSSISDVLEGTKYAASQSGLIKNIKHSKRQDNDTVVPLPINVEVDDSSFVNDRTSLSSRSTFKQKYDSSQFLSSETYTISPHYILVSKPSVGVNSVPYHSTVQSSEFENINPCHLLEDFLCKNAKEVTTQQGASNSPSQTDLGATRASDFSLSVVSNSSSVITSLPEIHPEKHTEHFTPLEYVEISKLFDSERTNSSEISRVSDSFLFSKPSVLSEAGGYSQTLSFGNATLNSVNNFESLSLNTFPSEDQTYWTNKHKYSSHKTSRRLTEVESLSLVSDKTRKTSSISSALAQRPLFTENGTSDHLERITVLGLFELTTRAGERAEGRSELAAARLAVSHINEKRLLPGYQLELITNDTKVTGVFSLDLLQYNEICFCEF